jgi:3-deoxy-manno-octulosonate cytidylyltransferase (CMP-KDO synthetase)
MTKVIAIIPARMAATRFPNKPLIPILGLPMIEHVRRRVSMSKTLSDVIVATCDHEIREAVEGFGGKVMMTKDVYERCTDRIAEAALKIEADIVINVQGDEPLILPEMLDDLIDPFEKDHTLHATNLVSQIRNDEEFLDPNAPKVVANLNDEILYISREAIPSNKKYSKKYMRFKQLGIIAFRSDFLQTFSKLEPTPLEIVESVDMMRAIEHGYKLKMVKTNKKLQGVDIPSDVEKVENLLKEDPLIRQYLTVS